jgi:hypothetical protein
MALDRAQLLSGNTAQGDVLSGEVQGVSAGSGITIAANGAISVNPTTITAFVKLNNPAGYNSYVWPTVSGTAGTFLSVDGSGNLSWQTTGATVTVQPQPAPSNPTEGDLWFDCTEGSIKIYQSCVSPAGWTRLGQTGFSAEPGNTTCPDFTQGGGTILNPYRLPATDVPSGESVLLPYTITVINVAPGSFVPIVDLNNATNDNRFDVNNRYADDSGVLTFQPTITDIPPSPNGTTYTALARVGNLSAGDAVYIELPITITNPLFIQPGAISGNPAENETLLYTQGAINGGQAPYIKAQAWLKNGVYIPGETGTTYDVTAADNGSVITVEYTVVDQNGYRATAVTAPVGPIGAIALPSNTSSNPAFVVGDGTITNPFQLTSINVGAGTSALFPQVITITGLDPQEFIPIVDRNVDVNGGRFTFTNSYANGVGDLTFQVRFSDTPESNEGTGYTALIQAGSNSVYFEGTAGVNQALTVSPGYISGNPTLGSTLTYNVGTASGGTTPYIYSYQWQRNENPISGATGTTYVATSADLGTNLTVKITVKDGQNTTASALSAAYGPISTAAFPPTSWDPLPSNGLETLPGGESGEYNGTGSVITTSGCLEASVNGGAYSIGSQACVSGDILAVRWNTGASCGGASSGTTITGSITDGVYTNDYSITIDRVPNSLPNVSSSGVALNATVVKTIPQTISGINTAAYVTYSSASTGSAIQVSKDGGSNYTVLATSGKGFSVNIGDTLIVSQIVGSTIGSSYDAIIRVGDGSNTAGTYDEFVFNATTVSDPAWPNLPNTLRIGPTSIPQVVSAVWKDSSGTVTSSGCIEVSTNGSTWGSSANVTKDSTTLYLRWKGIYNGGGITDTNCGNNSDGTLITGQISGSGGGYYQDYSLILSKLPENFSIPALTNQSAGATVYSETLSWKNTNAPSNIWRANTSTLTNLQVSIDGGAWTNLTANGGGSNLYVNPNSIIQFRGTTGSSPSTTYTMVFQIRDQKGGGFDTTWNVKTAAATPTITTPSITSPIDGATNLNPAENDPPGITLVGSAYSPLNGAGNPQTGSSWELYKGAYPLISTNTITGITEDPSNSTQLSPEPQTQSIFRAWYNPYTGDENPSSYTVRGVSPYGIQQISNPLTVNWGSEGFVADQTTAKFTCIRSIGNIVLGATIDMTNSYPGQLYVNCYDQNLNPSSAIPQLFCPAPAYYYPTISVVGNRFIVSFHYYLKAISSVQTTYIYKFDVGVDTTWQTIMASRGGGVFGGAGDMLVGSGVMGDFGNLFANVYTQNVADPRVMRSTDGGTTWEDTLFTNADSQGIYQVQSVSGNYVMALGKTVATDSFYTYPPYYSTDGGTNWSALNTSSQLPNFPLSSGLTYPTNFGTYADQIFVICQNNGSKFWTTVDPSGQWTENVTIPTPTIYDTAAPLYLRGTMVMAELRNSVIENNASGGGYDLPHLFPDIVGSTVLSISGALSDGFQTGISVKSTPSGGAGTISAIDDTQVGFASSGLGFTVGQRLVVNTASYSIAPGSPYSGVSGALTTAFIPQADLDKSSKYYARVQYDTSNSAQTISDYSSWSEFTTAGSFLPTIGTALGGGYFAGQLTLDNKIYNLILSEITGQTMDSVLPATTYTTASAQGPYDGTLDNSDGAFNTLSQTQWSLAQYFQIPNWCIKDANGPNAGNYDPNNSAGTGINGYNDYYIPAVYELMMVYYYLKPTNNDNSTSGGFNYYFYTGQNDIALEPYNQTWTPTSPGQTPLTNFQYNGSQAITSGMTSPNDLRLWTSSQVSTSNPYYYENYTMYLPAGYFNRSDRYSNSVGTRVVRKQEA